MNKIQFPSINDTDIKAIFAALLLLPEIDSDAPLPILLQDEADTESLAVKLNAKSLTFTVGETVALCRSVVAARDYLTGKLELDLSPETVSELKRYVASPYFKYHSLGLLSISFLQFCEKFFANLQNRYCIFAMSMLFYR